MKILTIILMTYSFSVFAGDCPLTSDSREKLLQSASHSVDDVKCVKGKLRWYISNKKTYLKDGRSESDFVHNYLHSTSKTSRSPASK